MTSIVISDGRKQDNCYGGCPCFRYLHVLLAIDALTTMQVNCQTLLSFIPCSDLPPTYRGCLKKLRTIRCSYGWTNYFYVFISLCGHQRRSSFCATSTSDEWDLKGQCVSELLNLFCFHPSVKIMSCWFSSRIFVRSVCCVLCVTSRFCGLPHEMSVLLNLYLCCVFLIKLRLF